MEIDKIAFIEIKDGRILSTRSKGKEKFYIPGGKREENETDHQTLIREIKEELDIAVDKNSIAYIGTFKAQADSHKEGISVKMTCYKATYKGIPKPTSEIEEIKWLTCKDLGIISEVDKKIFTFLKEQGLIT